jgi:hypothetical protein
MEVNLLEYLNQYSNLLIALATIASAFFASVIWYETRKYRKITNELKDMNKKLYERDIQDLRVNIPSHIEHNGYANNQAKFFIPIWITNLSSKPDSLLYFHVKNGDSDAIVYSDTSRLKGLIMPLEEPINLGPLSSVVKYILLYAQINPGSKMFPTFTFKLAYKGTDEKLAEMTVKFQANYNNKQYELTKIET